MEQKQHPMENTLINDLILSYLCSSLSPLSACLLWPSQTGLRLWDGAVLITLTDGARRSKKLKWETGLA
jgi:hypothetical protein